MHDKKRQELYELFQAEATEHLERMNEILLQLEAGSSAPEEETLRELFRVAHSLKGAARTVNRTAIERVAHALESVFEAVRSGKLGLDPDIADVLYDGLDSIQVLLSGQTEQLDLDGVLANLAGLITDEDVSPPGPSIPDQPSPHAGPPQEPPGLVAPLAVTQEIPAIDHQATDETIRVPVGKLDHLMAEVSNLLVAHMNIEHRVASLRELRAMHRRWQKQWRRVNTTYIRLVRAVTQNPAEMSQWKPVLDFLQETQRYMRITGKQFTAVERALNEDSLALGFAADALQSGVRDLRLLPFETIVGVLQRTVRDVARELNKEVLFRTVGTRIELDKHVLELLKDPLIHILRNALDHGIEPPDTRERLGKPRQGLILLSLMQRSSKVHVIITDDGYGIDPERVMRRAAQIDLVSSDDAQHMNETEIYELLMQPGMSTRETVSTISGRGVGLDVVRDHLEALQGQIQIRSRIGEGTSFELVLPVSLSTIHCMLVRTGNELYAIPTTAVLRVIEYHADAVFQVKGKPMLRLDNSPVPVAFLADTLERGHQLDEIGAEALAIVLSSADRQYAFVVDDIVAEQEVVVRNLNSEMARVRNVSGATLLANGEIVIILNVSDLIRSAQGKPVRRREIAPPALKTSEPSRILVVDDSITTRTLQKNILEAAGYDVATATHGVEALDILSSVDINLVICDVEMPWMDGFELTRRLREHPKLKNLPVILVTSLDAPEHKERGFKAGADAYIAKGVFDQNELLNTIQTFL